ncbi:hypothetical protein [Desertimonas flava]|jgi:hypothetical protein|uniref:hypothetical protein n=1 Tax=Desertimonas flava TaxID=2064846 RepID=UPI000E3408ED|nr:hypothetical protein [Desertimonas flava]
MSEPQILFFLTKLADPSRRDEYEQWVRDVDIPSVMAWPCTTDYRVVRLSPETVLEGVGLPGYDYIEIMEVSSLADYQADVAGSPPELFEGFASHIGPFEAAVGSVVR